MQPSTQVKKDPELLSTPQRWAGLYTDLLMLLLLAFFALHQQRHTGFFTAQFRWPEMIALYVPILISLAPPIQRLVQGRRNSARPLEAITDLSLAIGSLWLVTHFPFDFTHLADIFPQEMRFAFTWINNNVGRLILILQTVIGFLSAISTYVTYRRSYAKLPDKSG